MGDEKNLNSREVRRQKAEVRGQKAQTEARWSSLGTEIAEAAADLRARPYQFRVARKAATRCLAQERSRPLGISLPGRRELAGRIVSTRIARVRFADARIVR